MQHDTVPTEIDALRMDVAELRHEVWKLIQDLAELCDTLAGVIRDEKIKHMVADRRHAAPAGDAA